MDAVREKLKALEEEYNGINEQLMDQEVMKDPSRIASLSRRQARLNAPVEARHQLMELDERIEQAEAMKNDAEMKEMAEAELTEC